MVKYSKRENFNWHKVVALVIFALLIISIIPIIIASFYSHPIADDFLYSEKVYHVLNSNDSIINIFEAGIDQVKTTYNTWQGTFSAVFLFCFQPGVFSQNSYFWTTIILLLSLLLSAYIFIKTVLVSYGYGKKHVLLLWSIIMLLSINFVPDVNEAFFWWNGAIYYTLFYSFSLLLISLAVKLYFVEIKSKRVLYMVFSIILAVMIGGGNFPIALFSSVAIFIALLASFRNKKVAFPYYLVIFMVLEVCFAISIAAPGNSIRASHFAGESPIMAIINSIISACWFIVNWTGTTQLACFLIVFFIAKKLTVNSKYSYKYPLLMLIGSVLIYATQFTPSLYAMNSVGDGRLINIYYYSYYFLITFNIFYFCGWINTKDLVSVKVNYNKTYSYMILIAFLEVLTLNGCLNYGITNITFFKTSAELINGTPQQYSREYNDIIDELIKGNTIISDIETVPSFFKPFGISSDANYWKNKQIAQYYGLDEIRLISEGE